MTRRIIKLGAGILSAAVIIGALTVAYFSEAGMRLRVQLGQKSAGLELALRHYRLGEVGPAISALYGPVSEGYSPALSVLCDFQAAGDSAPSKETCVMELEQNEAARMQAATDLAIWAEEWEAAREGIEARLAAGERLAAFDKARLLALSRPDLDVQDLIETLDAARAAGDVRGQYAMVVAELNVGAEGKLSPVLAQLLVRRPALSEGEAYFELAKLIQTGAISSDLGYETVLMRADTLGSPHAAGHLAQYYIGAIARAEGEDSDDLSAKLRHFLTKAAQNGDPIAAHNLAVEIINDPKKTVPLGEAVKLLDMASKAGFVPASTLLGATLWRHPDLFNESEEEVRAQALTLLEGAAAKDDANALFNLGSLYLSQGQDKRAAGYLMRGAALGHDPSEQLLAQVLPAKNENGAAETVREDAAAE